LFTWPHEEYIGRAVSLKISLSTPSVKIAHSGKKGREDVLHPSSTRKAHATPRRKKLLRTFVVVQICGAGQEMGLPTVCRPDSRRLERKEKTRATIKVVMPLQGEWTPRLQQARAQSNGKNLDMAFVFDKGC